MASSKTTTLTFRIEPALKDGLRAAAVKEHRSVANMIAVMIRDYCGRNDITIQQHLPLLEKRHKPLSRKR